MPYKEKIFFTSLMLKAVHDLCCRSSIIIKVPVVLIKNFAIAGFQCHAIQYR